jgi:hypothetical protein
MSLEAEIVRALEEGTSAGRGDVRRDGGTGAVWRLNGAGPAVEAARDRILNRLLSGGAGVLVRYDESPDDPALAPHVTGSPSEGFRVAAGAPVASLREWLSLGNWFLTHPPRPVPPVDLARATAESVAAFVAAHDLLCVIDSFHDDTLWTVGFGRTRPEGRGRDA